MKIATVSYRKTREGEWAAFGPATSIRAGLTVTITKKDGTEDKRVVERVSSTFKVNGVDMVYGYLKSDRQTRSGSGWGRGPRVSAGHWLCPGCEEENPFSSSNCWECGCGRSSR